MATSTRTALRAADQKLIDGIQKNLATTPSLTVGSQTMTPAALEAVLQGRITTGNAVVTAEAAWQAALQADAKERTTTAPLVKSFKRIVVGMYEQSPDTLAQFGLKAPKSRAPSVATKALAVAKTKATRTARHTMGSQQKKAVTGTVTATSADTPLISPPPTGGASAQAATPSLAPASTPAAATTPHAT